jgi:hypothetical protein
MAASLVEPPFPEEPPPLLAPPLPLAPPALLAPPLPVVPPELDVPPAPVAPPELVVPPEALDPPADVPPADVAPPELDEPPLPVVPPVAGGVLVDCEHPEIGSKKAEPSRNAGTRAKAFLTFIASPPWCPCRIDRILLCGTPGLVCAFVLRIQ